MLSEKLLVCERCGSIYFEPTFMLYKVSPLESKDGKGGLAPIEVFKCSDCGNVNKEFLQTEDENNTNETKSSLILGE